MARTARTGTWHLSRSANSQLHHMKIFIVSALVAAAGAGFSCPKSCQDAVVNGLNALWTGIKITQALTEDDDSGSDSGSQVERARDSTQMNGKATLICQDTCVASHKKIGKVSVVPFTSDGECDDGGPDSKNSVCFPGTDCSDCGAMVVNEIDECFKECPAIYDIKVDFGFGNCKDYCMKRVPLVTLLRYASASNLVADSPAASMKTLGAAVWMPVAVMIIVLPAVVLMRKKFGASSPMV